jgi:predicted Zn-dependent peptidase
MNYKKIELPNYNLNLLQTSKFKSTRIKITFATHLNKDTVTKRALLPYMMRAITKNYPTRDLLNQKLEEMYAGNVTASVDKRGLTHIITFDLQLINNNYTLDNEDLLKEGLLFLKEVLYNPLFTEQTLKDEIRLMEEYHMGIYANKMRYALKEAMHIAYEGELYDIGALGTKEDLEGITLEDVEQTYQSMITNDLVNISVVSDMDEDLIKKDILSTFTFRRNDLDLVLVDQSRKDIKTITTKVDIQDVTQSKVVITYQLPVYYLTDDYYKAVVLNSLIGGSSESLLFNRIREELSLVYFIGSLYDNYKGSFVIYSGINKEDQEQVLKEVDNIISMVINEEVSEELLQTTKTTLISSLIESYDSIGSLTSRINDISLFDRPFNIENIINSVSSVSIKDLSFIAKKLQKQVIYTVRGEDNES